MWKLAAASLFLLSTGSAAAQDRAMEVAQMEHAFAAKAAESGVRAAFLEYLAPDAVIFRKGPVNAHEFLSAQPARPTVLVWRPVLAELSRAGDMGYTTGPSYFKPSPDRPIAGGSYYVTVWQRRPDGTLRAVIDHGIGLPASPDMEQPLRLLTPEGAEATSSSADSLRHLDAAPVRVHADVRTYARAALHRGEAARTALFADSAPVLRALGGGIAQSRDIGYTYGAYEWGRERGHYVRVWRHGAHGWEVIVDLYGADD